MKLLLKKLLGEENCSFGLDDLRDASAKWNNEHIVNINDEHVLIKGRSSIARLIGFPPLYYFKGNIQKTNNDVKVVGRISMALIPRGSLILWWTLVCISLVVGIAISAFFAIKLLMFATGDVKDEFHQTVTFVGVVLAIGFSGSIVTTFILMIYKKQKERLIPDRINRVRLD